MDKEKISDTAARVIMTLQQRNFTADETRALLLTIEKLLQIEELKQGQETQ